MNMDKRLCLFFCCIITFIITFILTINNSFHLSNARSRDTNPLCHTTVPNQSNVFVLSAEREKLVAVASSHPVNESGKNKEMFALSMMNTRNSSLHITTVFSGRFGNHLFIYATLLGVAMAQNRRPVIRDGIDLGTAFQLSFVNPNISTDGWQVVNEFKHTIFESRFMDLPEINLTLRESFQSWKYFHHIENEIRGEFTFIPSIQNEVKSILASHRVKLKNHALVGVHVRRGDFLTPDNVKLGYDVPNATYFFNAFSRMRSMLAKQNVTFLVASDDFQWCLTNLNDSDVKLLPAGSPAFHMATLAGCDHVIISGGTFGWWSAWLANGITIYYTKYIMEHTRLDEGFNKDDYYLPGWIGLDG